MRSDGIDPNFRWQDHMSPDMQMAYTMSQISRPAPNQSAREVAVAALEEWQEQTKPSDPASAGLWCDYTELRVDVVLAALEAAGYRIARQSKVDGVYSGPYETTVDVGDGELNFYECAVWVDEVTA